MTNLQVVVNPVARQRKRKTAKAEEVVELMNLVKNTLNMPHTSDVENTLGISSGNFTTWRKTSTYPAWLPWALKGILSTTPTRVGAQQQVVVGMRFTNHHLDLLNSALAAMPSTDPELRRLRSVVLLELASRLES